MKIKKNMGCPKKQLNDECQSCLDEIIHMIDE